MIILQIIAYLVGLFLLIQGGVNSVFENQMLGALFCIYAALLSPIVIELRMATLKEMEELEEGRREL